MVALHKVLCNNSVGGAAQDMATNLGIDEKLLSEAKQIGGEKTKKSTVNSALREYIQRRRQLKALELMGTIDFAPGYDYKRERRRKRGGADG
jgi:Bacterial antitoxin of type II TA system, VapB